MPLCLPLAWCWTESQGVPQVRAAWTGQGLPEQLGPVLEPVLLRFCSILPWRPGTPQLRL